jgi:stage II sporulation protein D
MFRYVEENIAEKDYLTDDTDCQVFFGVTGEQSILKAVEETRGKIILGRDNKIIECPFHSNCGGVTSSSGDVWISYKPYLKSISDPFCNDTKNARWEKSFSLERWVNYVKKSGYPGKTDDPSVFGFLRQSRSGSYQVGSFNLAFTRIRTDMHLPSAFFSVILKGDSVVLRGRGYGHGVGLCQEGAMKMAKQGYSYQQIINFYYSGVLITDIEKATVVPQLINMLGSYVKEQDTKTIDEISPIGSEGIILPVSR